MSKNRKVIITCAPTGAIHTPSMSPYLPVTADQIAEAAIAAAEAGAAILHLHARDPQHGADRTWVATLVLLVPPLVWGWLAMQVMSFDVLADHATPQERAALMKQHRWPLLGIGVASGLLGAAPGAVWVFSALTLVLAPLVMVASIWLYTAVFALTSLWFAHYLLAALQRHRLATEGEVLDPLPTGAAVLDPAALAAPPSSAPPAASQP